MIIQEYINTKDYSTFKIGGQFRYFTIINNIEDIISSLSFSKDKDLPIFILGGGSNVIFSDGTLNIFALKNEIKGFEVINETNEYVDIKVGAGEIWDDIVKKTVDMNLSGFESLSAIPGTVGASPVQNIGAYGSEVKDTILEVEVFDTQNGDIISISNVDCKFGYRDSIFKNEKKGKYIITAVTYRLYKADNASHEIIFLRSSDEGGQGARPSKKEIHAPFLNTLKYPGVSKYFEDKKIENPTLKQIREAIIDIRKDKLPDPREIPNVGSFFKNPIVLIENADKIKKDFPDAKFFPIDNNYMKVPAGWLIENTGLKGESFGSISIYNKNALVLINNGNASLEDLIKAKNEIIEAVNAKFRIILEQEPEII